MHIAYMDVLNKTYDKGWLLGIFFYKLFNHVSYHGSRWDGKPQPSARDRKRIAKEGWEGAEAAADLYSMGVEGHHKPLAPFFSCNLNRANVKIVTSTGRMGIPMFRYCLASSPGRSRQTAVCISHGIEWVMRCNPINFQQLA